MPAVRNGQAPCRHADYQQPALPDLPQFFSYCSAAVHPLPSTAGYSCCLYRISCPKSDTVRAVMMLLLLDNLVNLCVEQALG